MGDKGAFKLFPIHTGRFNIDIPTAQVMRNYSELFTVFKVYGSLVKQGGPNNILVGSRCNRIKTK